MRFDRKKFFDGARELLRASGVQLTQPRVDGLEFLIGEFEKTGWDIRWIAYALATVAHETGFAFEPVTERGARWYFDKYEPSTGIGKRLGNIHAGDGYLFRGRGYVQITGRSNYIKFGIAAEPDKALEPPTAFRILQEGMTRGAFTGKRLADYIGRKTDYASARQIINGHDKANTIAGYARRFENILRNASTD